MAVDKQAIEKIMSSMGQGIVYVDSDKRIQMCNSYAKKITGIIIDAMCSHEGGRLDEGDIVIIADNKIGEDDGETGHEELSALNINDRNIRPNDMLIAVAVYKNNKIEPQYKYVREHQLNVPLAMDTNYLGFQIRVEIDTDKRETLIAVKDREFRLKFFSSVGNMVVIDGMSGTVKFFEAKGYTVRRESIGDLLRGGSFVRKAVDLSDVDVCGRRYLEVFDKSELSDKLDMVLSGSEETINNKIYEINKRPFLCSIVPWEEDGKTEGVFLIMQEAERLESILDSRNEIIGLIEENEKAVRKTEFGYPPDAFKNFIGKSAKANEVKYMAYKASQNRFNVIITGESGTGKSKLAHEIHRLWNPDAPFIEVNCNAIAPTLFESELFGYVGGAFTGARPEGKVGFFESANKGTIFLDEIGEIPLEIQVKLLHVLQDKIIYRVGSSKPVKVDVRVIAATNKNLEEEVMNGHFRQDLYYRINVFPIEIPPLRERKPDLYLLINKILSSKCEEYGIESKKFSGDALQKLISYNWPGNVRELENAIERAITLCESNIIYPEYLSVGTTEAPKSMKELLEIEEKRIIEGSMIKNNGDKSKVMDELKLSRTVFYEKLKKYSIK